MDYAQWNPGNHDLKRNNIPSRDKQSKKINESCLTNTEYGCMNLQRPKPHRQTLRSKAKIPLVLSLQASLPPHPAGEDEVEERSERREQRLAKRVNVTARRREELLEAGCWVKK